MDVIAVPTSNTPSFRTRYIQTDATTPYFLFANDKWIIYNPPTNRFFVTDPGMNRVIVLDAATETMIGSIPVPGAFGIDDTPDHSMLYVGTQMGDVYEVDPVTMTVTKRYLASQIGPYGFKAYSVRVMADGRLALLGEEGGLNVDGFGDFAIWNPVDNSITIYASSYGGGQLSGPGNNIPYDTVCGPLGDIGTFERTPDRSRVLIASIDSDGTVCEVNETTGASTYVQPVTEFVSHVAQTPDGKWLIVPDQSQSGPSGGVVDVLDAHTLAKVAQFNVAGDMSSAASLFVSPDSSTLYMTSQTNLIYAYSLSTFQMVGWFPGIYIRPLAGGLDYGPDTVPDIQATDGTGLLVGPMEEGVGFLDSWMMHTGPVGTWFTNACLNPVTGPPAGDTQTGWSFRSLNGTLPLSQVYVGSQVVPSFSSASDEATITTPPGAPGPADVYALMSDGGAEIIPKGFSYGPTILEVTPNMSSAGGGGFGVIYGYGFGPPNEISGIPPGLQVTVGGRPATITGFAWNAYDNAYNPPCPPLPLQFVTYTIPPGTSGSAADVTVSTSAGSTTLHAGLTYLPAIEQFPLPGAVLAQGIYDPYNDLYYFTDATSIRVFSLSVGAWQTSIAIAGAQRLWGIALSPDGSQMAVSDAQGGKVYVLDPANPSAVQSFAVPQPPSGGVSEPTGIAISNSGMVYSEGYGGLFKLDSSTGQVTEYGLNLNGVNGQYLRVAIASDGSAVYLNSGCLLYRIDAATDSVSSESDIPNCASGNNEDMAVSVSPTQIMATDYYFDANLNSESYQALNIREGMNISYVYGEKLSPDGSLLFIPSTNGIDVFNARVGRLLDRVALPVALSPNYDALVSDGTDNLLLAITGDGDGIAAIDFTSIAEPAPLPYTTLVAATPRVAKRRTTQSELPASLSRSVPYLTTARPFQRHLTRSK